MVAVWKIEGSGKNTAKSFPGLESASPQETDRISRGRILEEDITIATAKHCAAVPKATGYCYNIVILLPDRVSSRTTNR